jgi:hypothetical protein
VAVDDDDVDLGAAVSILAAALATGDRQLQGDIVDVLRAFGLRARDAIPQVRALLPTVDEATRNDIVNALVEIGDVDGVVSVAEQLRTDPWRTARALEALGPQAAAAVPVLRDVVVTGDWLQQAVAARALGAIEDASAVDVLVAALESRSWRVVQAAAVALGKIGAASSSSSSSSSSLIVATDQLYALRDRHWSLLVRDAADTSLRQLAGETVQPRDDDDWTEDHGLACVPTEPASSFDEPPQRFVRVGGRWVVVDERWLPGTEPLVGRPQDALPPTVALPALAVPVIPAVLEVDDGWLVARDAGEWGGDLLFVRRDGVISVVVHGNVRQVVRLDGVVYAIGGIAHMFTDAGTIWRLEHRAGWHAEQLAELPHAPTDAAVIDGRLVVVSSDEASDVAPDGSLHLLPCRLSAR